MSAPAEAALDLGRELAARVGAAHVVTDAETRSAHAVDGVTPQCVVEPADAAEVAAVLRFASENDLVVVPSGNGSKLESGLVPERVDIVLRTRRLNTLEFYDPGDLTIGAGVGMTLAELDAKLAPNQQFLPLDAAHGNETTLGGALATAARGPLRHAYGSARDYCIGMRFVTGDGLIVQGGGRVVKNVAGYDLMKLLIGSHGTLGVIVSANFKLFPRPRAESLRTFACSFPTMDEALAFRDHLLRSPLTPVCLDLVSPRAQEYLEDAGTAREVEDIEPGEQRPAPVAHWRVLIRAAGSERVLARYRREMGGDVRELEGKAEADEWSKLSNFAARVLERHHNGMILQLSAPTAEVASALQAAESAALDNNLLPAAIGRAGAGTLLIAFIPLSVDPPSAMQYANAVSALRASLPYGASAWVTHAPREARLRFNVWGTSPTDLDCMREVKHALDPKNILNRGRYMV